MVLVSEECARILDCPISLLRDRLNHPSDRNIVLKELMGRKVRTTYPDRNDFNKTFMIGGLSLKGADSLQAYGRLKRPFNVCVAAHFYARHRIKLHNPFLHCIIESFNSGGEDRYYPMELLEFIKEDVHHNWLDTLFTEISKNKDESPASTQQKEELTDYEDAHSGFFDGRDQLSQWEYLDLGKN
jgi:hypothetical protein